jgi:fatty acid desaturase
VKWLAIWYAIYTAVLFVNRVRMLTAHHFALDGTPTDHLGQFADSIDTPSGWWAELWAPLGMRFHALHHLFPTLPFHNMRPAYERLMGKLPADSFYRAATGRGLLASLRGILFTSPRRITSP